MPLSAAGRRRFHPFCVPAVGGGGSAAPVFRPSSFTSNAANSTAYTITIPSAVAVGDLMLIGYFYRDGSTESAPSGWSVAVADFTASSGNHCVCWYRVATAGDTGGATTVSFNDTFSGSCAVFAAYSGAAASPFDTTGTNSGTSTSPQAPSVTTTGANRTVVCFYGETSGGTNNNQVTPPATNRGSQFAGHACAGISEFAAATAGATAAQTASLTGSDTWGAITVPIHG